MIRPAVEDDIPALVTMGTRFIQEHYSGLVEADPEAMANTGRWLMTHGLLLVAHGEHGPIGMIGAALVPHPFSGQLTVFELFWWVDPDHRGPGVKLLRLVEQWGRVQGATRMQLVAPSMRVGAFYERLGYWRVEEAWQRSL